ncbi:MAG: hypothetical protein QXK37_03180 [Candidatus Woesearchaeota archaeon]
MQIEIIFKSAQILIGLLFTLFIPGFCLDLLLFKRKPLIERVALGILFSMLIDLGLTFFLAGSKTAAKITGGLMPITLWAYLIAISAIFFFAFLYSLKKQRASFKDCFIPEFSEEPSTIKPRHFFLAQIALLILMIIFFYQKASGRWPYWLFWPIIIAQIAISGYAVMRLKSHKRLISILILEFAITGIFVFGMVEPFQMNTDSYFEAQFASTIVENGYWDPTLGYGLATNYYGYNPMVHILIAFLSLSTGLDTFIVTKYIMLFFIRGAIALIAYLFALELFSSRNVAAYSALFFVGAHGYVLIFVSRRYVAALLILYYLYLLLLVLKKKEIIYAVLAILTSFAVVLSDHANSYLLAILMTAGILFSFLASRYLSRPVKTMFKPIYLFVYVGFIILYVSFVAQVFINQDFKYVKDITDYVGKEGKETTSTTFETIIKSTGSFCRGLYWSTIRKLFQKEELNRELDKSIIIRLEEGEDYEEILAIINKSGYSIKEKEKLIDMIKDGTIKPAILSQAKEGDLKMTSGTGLRLTYVYELFIIILSQAMFLILGVIGGLSFLFYLKQKKLDVVNLPDILFLIAFGVIGFLVLGILINGGQVVFTYTYFWLFSFILSISIAFFVLFGGIKKVSKYLLIPFLLLLFIGTLLIDYSPTLVNRPLNEGVYVEHQYAIRSDIIASAIWAEENIENYPVLADSSVFKFYSSHYGITNQSGIWYTTAFYLNPKKVSSTILNNFGISYIVINENFFRYNSAMLKMQLNEKHRNEMIYQGNVVYHNGGYQFLRIGKNIN